MKKFSLIAVKGFTEDQVLLSQFLTNPNLSCKMQAEQRPVLLKQTQAVWWLTGACLPSSILTELQKTLSSWTVTSLLVVTFMVNSIDTKSVIIIQGRVSQIYATSPLRRPTKETTTQYRRQATTQFSYDILISNRELIEGFFPPYKQQHIHLAP